MMAERTIEDAVAMSRRELARLQADEMSRALNPFPGRGDDQITFDEKADMSVSVAALQAQHRRELSAWNKARY